MVAIYGANASGQSNIVKAFAFFQKMLTTGSFPIGSTEKYCKIDTKTRISRVILKSKFLNK